MKKPKSFYAAILNKVAIVGYALCRCKMKMETEKIKDFKWMKGRVSNCILDAMSSWIFDYVVCCISSFKQCVEPMYMVGVPRTCRIDCGWVKKVIRSHCRNVKLKHLSLDRLKFCLVSTDLARWFIELQFWKVRWVWVLGEVCPVEIRDEGLLEYFDVCWYRIQVL